MRNERGRGGKKKKEKNRIEKSGHLTFPFFARCPTQAQNVPIEIE
jgi:hypothetical protein